MGFRLSPKAVILNDLERRDDHPPSAVAELLVHYGTEKYELRGNTNFIKTLPVLEQSSSRRMR